MKVSADFASEFHFALVTLSDVALRTYAGTSSLDLFLIFVTASTVNAATTFHFYSTARAMLEQQKPDDERAPLALNQICPFLLYSKRNTCIRLYDFIS
ncbi:hypothetical protein [Bifidobacterium aquikefiricola]|uniref:Uncharacterized protein n=1 Tax=Bifidobacterium aquikefiricola TaxID=3059038 RepID=A0AB39U4N3_9BIFI